MFSSWNQNLHLIFQKLGRWPIFLNQTLVKIYLNILSYIGNIYKCYQCTSLVIFLSLWPSQVVSLRISFLAILCKNIENTQIYRYRYAHSTQRQQTELVWNTWVHMYFENRCPNGGKPMLIFHVKEVQIVYRFFLKVR